MILIINSPNGKPPLEFSWPLTEKEEYFLRVSIELFALDCPMVDVKTKFSSIVQSRKITTFEQAANFVHLFNLMAANHGDINLATPEFLKHIIELSIDYVDVSAIKKSLPPNSEKTYGEITYELMKKICHRMCCEPNSTYIDLGSGIGQTVLQMAGTMYLKKCIGIEIRNDLFVASTKIFDCFVELMVWFGKFHSEIELIEGDITSEAMSAIAFNTDITHYFINNMVMGPTINNYIMDKLMTQPYGMMIDTSHKFVRGRKYKSIK